ncbi:DMT family transporter [Arenibacterium sp. LLYu02]|uniref:DMT family transporter n=1 Tax=Arenibacterium sp. LLYu02 TaxID=3404132 RepID=UPI003B214703
MSITQSGPITDHAAMAVVTMVLTNLTLSVADAIIKVAVAEMPLTQFIFLRSCITLPLLIVLLRWRFPGKPMRPVHLGWAIARSSLVLASLLLYYASLPRLDFSIAAAAYYTIPLFVTVFAALWTQDRVGIQGWFGVALGFCGVMLMLKPKAGSIDPAALLPLVSAILYAVAMVMTRTRNRGENPFVLALVFNLIAIFFGGLGWLVSWSGSGPETLVILSGSWVPSVEVPWAVIGLLSLTMLVGSVGTAAAYQLGPPPLVSTWDFSYLAFAVLLGVGLFSETLDLASLLGIALIPLAGMIVIRR